MREICHIQAGQCGNQIGSKVTILGHDDNTIIIIYNIQPGSHDLRDPARGSFWFGTTRGLKRGHL